MVDDRRWDERNCPADVKIYLFHNDKWDEIMPHK
jgi:hypothetical protein